MTQLDRLEALADLDSWLGREQREVRLHLPDLIRVARTARQVWDTIPSSFDPDDPAVSRHAEAMTDLAAAMLPLFAEVES